MLKELYPIKTPVLVFIGEKWRHGYYMGLTGFRTHHVVCIKPVLSSGQWRVRNEEHIKPDPTRRVKKK